MTHKNNPSMSKSEETEQDYPECFFAEADSNLSRDEFEAQIKQAIQLGAELRRRIEEEERRNAQYREFKNMRGYEKQIAFFHQILDDGLMYEQNAFDILSELYDKAVDRGNEERKRIDSMIIKLRELEPEAYADSADFFLEWQIINALATRDFSALPDLTQEAVIIASQPLWRFNELSHLLAYHNQLPTLVEMTRAAFYKRQKNEARKEHYNEFITLAIDAEVLAYLEDYPAPESIPTALRKRIEPFNSDNHVNWSRIEQDIAYLTGQANRQWKMQDVVNMQKGGDDLHHLTLSFMHYLRQQEDVPYSKSYLAHLGLQDYLPKLNEKIFDFPQIDLRQFENSWPDPPKWEHFLVPDHYTLYVYSGEIAHQYTIGKYYQLAAIFELVPAWLRFLNSLNLIDSTLLQQACSNLQGLDDKMLDLWESSHEAAFPEATKRWRDDLRRVFRKSSISTTNRS